MNKISFKNKIVAIILSVSMIVSLVPSFSLTFTAETDGEAPVCTCGTENDIHTEGCALYVAPTSTVCTTCQQETCICCEVCKNSPCTCDPAPTDPAQLVNTDETKPCTCTPVDGVHQADCASLCTCEPVDGVHLEGCALYVNIEPEKCEYCNVELIENAVHLDNCLTFCTCEPKPTGEEAHTNTACKFYVAPVAVCEYCKIELTENAVHLDNCLTFCTCEPKPTGEEAHTNTACKFYASVEPVDESSDISSEQGKTPTETRYGKVTSLFPILWKDPTNTQDQVGAQPSLLPEIVVILETYVFSETTTLYKIDAADGYTWPEEYNGYHYINSSLVQEIEYIPNDEPGSDDSTDTIVDENGFPLCSCGENASEDLLGHANGCARYKYFRETYIKEKTAQEIFADWYKFDENTKNAILAFMSWDHTLADKYNELNNLLNGGSSNPDSSDSVVTDDGNTITVEGLFDNINISVSSVSKEQYHNSLGSFIDGNSELLYAYDITLTNPDGSIWQPESGKSVTVTLDFNGMGLVDGNTLKILHEHNGELRFLGESTITDGKLTFTTDGFSKFYFYITYTFGGHSFTMSGGSTVNLSDILRELAVPYAINDVVNVYFTNPEVLKITKTEIDWELESLSPFGSEETLVITFSNGETVEIAVKDPVIFNYAVGSEITNVTKLPTKQHTVAAVNNGDQAALGKTYTVNSDKITVDNVKSAGVAEKTTGVHPAPDAIHMIIYAKEGMAIDFIGGTDWTYAGSKPTFAGNDIWFWSWESSVSANYVVVKGRTAGQQSKFTVTTTVDGTKYYCNVLLCVVENSSPKLLVETLPTSGLSGLTIKNVPVTLYNYEGEKFNAVYDSNGTNYFAFSGYSKGVNAVKTNAGWGTSGLQANGGGGVALMGIVKDTLVNGLPEMSQGQKVDLFSTNAVNGKIVYNDVQFQFVYDENTGSYYYNSALNHAQYDLVTNSIKLYDQSLAISDTPNGTSHGNAGFYPFEDINKAYTNTGYTNVSWSDWYSKLTANQFELIPAEYSTDIVLSSSTNPASTADMHYGIQMNCDFYLPKGKKLNNQEMIYEFTGDDDLWVFIDGRLVLDIGGGHTYVSGSFNLTTGEVWVEKYTQLAAADGGSYQTRVQGTDLRYTDSFLTGLADDQMHTIQIFYLERHGGVSNCRMHFNLPLVPTNSVTVSKNLKSDAEDGSFIVKPDEEYTFTIYTAEDNDDDINATQFIPLANKEFLKSGQTYTTGINGQFTLKDGEIAIFDEIPRFNEVYIAETVPNDGYVYSKVEIDGKQVNEISGIYKSLTKVMPDGTLSFSFTNYMKVSDLTLKKIVEDKYGGLTGSEEYSFTVDLYYPSSDESKLQAGEAIPVVLKKNGSHSINNIPVGFTYEITETLPQDPSGFEFAAPLYAVNNGTAEKSCSGAIGEADTTVTVTNTLIALFADLTITKSGSQSIDENQTFLFKVTGTPLNGSTFTEMIVSINGDGSTVIKELPVGTYTVEELTDWSWRYDVSGITQTVNDRMIMMDYEASTGITLSSPLDTYEVTFTNIRKQTFWLSGDSWCDNLFSSSN